MATIWKAKGVSIKDKQFAPFQVETRDLLTGKTGSVTVIGVLAVQLDPAIVAGIYTNEATYAAVFGQPEYERAYLTLRAGRERASGR